MYTLAALWMFLAAAIPSITAARPFPRPTLTSATLALSQAPATTATTSATSPTLAAPRLPPVKEWWFRPRKDHRPSGAPTDVHFKNYPVSFLGDTGHKVVYLTFDAGSETGYLPAILDTLKAGGVHATFFVTRYYMKEAPETVRRMVAEGHTVANHSATHPTGLAHKGQARIRKEIMETAEYYEKLTGRPMPALWRPPCGECDEVILREAAALGWRTVFWSMAYEDWRPEQKGAQYATSHVMQYHHPGAIILLHPYESNSQALGTIIEQLSSEGYEFGSLEELPSAPAMPRVPVMQIANANPSEKILEPYPAEMGD